VAAGYDALVKEVLAEIDRWQAAGERVAIATVVATRRSAPRPVGAKLAVSESGDLAGSVSGGCVENEVYASAREVLDGGDPRLLTYGITDDMAFSVGLPCGGEIDVWVDAPSADELAPLLEVVRAEGEAVLLVGLDDGSRRLVRPGEDPLGDELLRTAHSRVLDLEGRRVFADVFAPPPRLLVFGAVDTAEALCAAAKALGWRTIVADARAKFATPERLPSADEILTVWPQEALAHVRPDHATAVLVLTHDDKFDLPALKGVLETDAFYVGALGSRKNQARRRERLLEAGLSEQSLERISGPAGLDIGAATPAETAISMLAEILAVRAGRNGGPLREGAGRIHVEVA
jgi:xanthine dehydrogenase accessory factor